MAFAKAGGPDDPDGIPFSWDWFNPFTGLTVSALVAGLSASIFSFWGWDTALTVNEESKDSEKTPGRAALLCVVSILLTYLLVSVATLMYAGDGDRRALGSANEDIQDNVFGALAEPVMGSPWHNLLFLAVLASSAASLMTTFLPSTRTMLGMASYKALPARFATIHPKYLTPSFGTIIAGIIAGTFYTVLTFVSESVLSDTILSLGLMICFYYGLTAIGCIWYFRKELFTSFYNFIFKFLFPLLGGLGLWFVFFVTIRDSANPEYTGWSVFGVGHRVGARPRADPDRRGLHVDLADEGTGLLPRRDAAPGHPVADHPRVAPPSGGIWSAHPSTGFGRPGSPAPAGHCRCGPAQWRGGAPAAGSSDPGRPLR